jgi:hypothetical protein
MAVFFELQLQMWRAYQLQGPLLYQMYEIQMRLWKKRAHSDVG